MQHSAHAKLPIQMVKHLEGRLLGSRFGVAFDLNAAAIAFFFLHFGCGPYDSHAQHGVMSYLAPVFLQCEDQSILRQATMAVAVNIFMLFSGRGPDTQEARKFYMQAVSQLKTMLARSDTRIHTDSSLIFATIMLNWYDGLNNRFSRSLSIMHQHHHGALALMKHRRSWQPAGATDSNASVCLRAHVVNSAVECEMCIDAESLELLRIDQMPQNKVQVLDVLSVDLVRIRARYKQLQKDSMRWNEKIDLSSYRDLIEDALTLESELLNWYSTLPENWFPCYLTSQDVAITIRDRSFYGRRCTVYEDIGICDAINTYRQRCLELLGLIRQCCNAHPTQANIELSDCKAEVMQQLADDICESLPFYLGDLHLNVSPDCMLGIQYPSARRQGRRYPSSELSHRRSALGLGGWNVYANLLLLLNLQRPTISSAPLCLRLGQLEWIKAQVRRVEIAYTFRPVLLDD